MDKPITSAQQELLDFFSPLEVPHIHYHLKQVYSCATFKTEANRDDLFSLWYIIELLEKIKAETNGR